MMVERHALQHLLRSVLILLCAGLLWHSGPSLAATGPREALPPSPPPATLTGAASVLDTWTMNAGRAEGWTAGDRVRVSRAGKAVAEGVLMKVAAHGSEVVMSKTMMAPRRGDTVEFARHRPAPPPEQQANAARGSGAAAYAQSGGQVPTDWQARGRVEGLLGDDWMERNTRCAHVFARKGDIQYVDAVVGGLDASVDVNRDFMGVMPRIPMGFYFFPLEGPAHAQPGFQTRLRNRTRFAGIALTGDHVVCINLGNWRTAHHYAPWEVEETCRHEMNHLFAATVRGTDRFGTWEWLYEALAHTIEDTVRPPSSQMTLDAIKAFMRGYRSPDASWKTLIGDRNDDSLENFRTYDKLLVSIIFFLKDRYGNDVVCRLMLAARGRDVEDAFVQVCGKGTQALQNEWKEYYGIK